MKTLVTINIGNSKSEIVTTNANSTNVLDTHNANVVYCIHQYVHVGNVVTIKVAKRGTKAAETFYNAILALKQTFIVKGDIINGEFVAVLLAANLKVA